MKEEIITLRLMQTRSLHHLWNSQARQPEYSLEELLEYLASHEVEVVFRRRQDDQQSGKAQQRLTVRIDAHVSVELKCRTFVDRNEMGDEVTLFAVGGIREILTDDEVPDCAIKRVCRVRWLNWKNVKSATEGEERELIAEIAGMEVSYLIEENRDVRLIREYIERRIKEGDEEAEKVKRTFNRVINPEKYGVCSEE